MAVHYHSTDKLCKGALPHDHVPRVVGVLRVRAKEQRKRRLSQFWTGSCNCERSITIGCQVAHNMRVDAQSTLAQVTLKHTCFCTACLCSLMSLAAKLARLHTSRGLSLWSCCVSCPCVLCVCMRACVSAYIRARMCRGAEWKSLQDTPSHESIHTHTRVLPHL